jgi:uncharacterized protein (TIGR02391 family)
MARKPTTVEPQPANLSSDQIRTAIPRIRRRIDELTSLQPKSLTEEDGDNILDDLIRKINATLREILGIESIEYREYRAHSLSAFPQPSGFSLGFEQVPRTSVKTRLPAIQKAIRAQISSLGSLLDILLERQALSDERVSALRAYERLDLHHEIARVASKLYLDGHYSNAVEAAVKALNGLVRLRSGLDVDGSPLMEKAFSPNGPVLRFNNLSDQSGKDEQRGFMMMFSGAVAGLRNPRAHGFIQDEPERALEFIAFVSLLAKLLEEAEKV